jgi:threonine/homoserine/homoserine lactone efflux protein
LKGLAFGASAAAPVGPMSLLCLHRTFERGRTVGILTGLGIACGDLTYSSLAAGGWSAVAPGALWVRAVQIAGGLYLVWIGTAIFRRKSEHTPIEEPKAVNVWLSAFLLTLANPPTILIYLTFFSTVIPSENFTPLATAALPAGVFCGSFLWWVFLAGVATRMGKKLSPSSFRRINVASGLVLTAFGLWAVLKGFGVWR